MQHALAISRSCARCPAHRLHCGCWWMTSAESQCDAGVQAVAHPSGLASTPLFTLVGASRCCVAPQGSTTEGYTSQSAHRESHYKGHPPAETSKRHDYHAVVIQHTCCRSLSHALQRAPHESGTRLCGIHTHTTPCILRIQRQEGHCNIPASSALAGTPRLDLQSPLTMPSPAADSPSSLTATAEGSRCERGGGGGSESGYACRLGSLRGAVLCNKLRSV